MADIINIAIVDDEKVQVELLQKYVQNWAEERKLRISIEPFFNAEGFEFVWSMDKKYQILLLDIQMSGQSGIELARKIRTEDESINIIFITAVAEYIGAGYDVAAINYLIKPIKEEKLHQCLDKAISKLPKCGKTILINTNGEIHRVLEDHIVYVEAFAHSIDVNTINGKFTTRKNISAIQNELDESSFIRCHRSYLVGVKYIKRIGSSELELDNGEMIPISRRQYASTNIAFINYFRGGINE
ncbi:response regulator transcription factor [Clostridium sp. YIM B02505]|uniref:Stage 0 sporulation protein A homolog n=1 Tax=Clostridium yunnanense TaxID=2800325 RepID=A0ABS1EVH4_9CLOT|nr:LytTR family DNA-binding domain-containing protein [Clostridium yunnanense]MBK1813340.1 response regulator transcription factor [Clostridium yunnanense]